MSPTKAPDRATPAGASDDAFPWIIPTTPDLLGHLAKPASTMSDAARYMLESCEDPSACQMCRGKRQIEEEDDVGVYLTPCPACAEGGPP